MAPDIMHAAALLFAVFAAIVGAMLAFGLFNLLLSLRANEGEPRRKQADRRQADAKAVRA